MVYPTAFPNESLMGVRLRVTLLKEGQVTQVKEEGGEGDTYFYFHGVVMVYYVNMECCVVATARKGYILGILEDSLVGHLALGIADSHLQPLQAWVNHDIACILQSI